MILPNMPLDVPAISRATACTATAKCSCGKIYTGIDTTLTGAGRRAAEKVAKCRAGLPGTHKQWEGAQK